MLVGLSLSLLLAAISSDLPASRLAVIRQAPDFALVNQDGKTVKLSDFKGKVLLVSFIFTTCNGACPATTHRMAAIHQQSTDAEFLSITLDPQRDTPEALRQYVRLFNLEAPRSAVKAPFGWNFLTGTPDVVGKTISAWGMWVKPTTNGQLDHPSRIFLVDGQQRIREIYNVDLLRPAEVLEDIAELLKEIGKKSSH